MEMEMEMAAPVSRELSIETRSAKRSGAPKTPAGAARIGFR